MATFIFDGTTNVTAAKADTVVISANPALFTSVSETGGNVVFNFGGKLLTVTGTTYGDNTTQYPNVSLANGVFATGANVDTLSAVGTGITSNNVLVIGGTTETLGAGTGNAAGVKAIFGGLGVSDSTDGVDTVTIGGKGSFLVYGNAGADAITQNAGNNFDSTSFVTVFGGKNAVGTNDVITLQNNTTGTVNNVNAKMAIYGGEGTDSISIANTGANAVTSIFGGQGAADSTDLADSINFNGGGQVNIFGNAGNDVITLGGNLNAGANASAMDSTTNAVIHGGRDADNINITVGNVKAVLQVYGDENNVGAGNQDSITIAGNAGTTTIYGGTAAADSNDGADIISYTGQGTATIYAAGGDDTITLGGAGTVTADSTSTVSVFGGNGNDSIILSANSVVGAAGATNTGTVTLTSGAGADVFTLGAATEGGAGTGVVGTGTGITITDFTIGTGGDVLNINNNVVNGANLGNKFIVDGSGASTLQQALDTAVKANSGTQGTVSLVTFRGDSYVVVHESGTNPNATFAQGTDLAVKLTGVTDLATLQSSITVV